MNGQSLQEMKQYYAKEARRVVSQNRLVLEEPPSVLSENGGTGHTESEWDPLQEIHLEPISAADFRRLTPMTGFLRIQAFIAGQAIPVSDAQVIVSKTFIDGRQVYASGVTDEDGILDGIELPAPDKSLSRVPGSGVPYAIYHVEVSHPGYRTEAYHHVPVFEGILSIQPVRFMPYQPTI